MMASQTNGSTAASKTLSVPETAVIYTGRSSLSESDRVSRLKVEIAAREKDDLEIIKKDVCEWLSSTLDIAVSPRSFMDTLDTGVVLCDLARLIQAKATSEREAGVRVTVNIPMEKIRCQPNAGKGTFFARDNTANFIKWCKKLGVNEEVIFESNGLVQQEDEKRVILCLIDVSRYASRVNIKPPELVRLENEIDLLECDQESEDSVFEESPPSPTIVCRYRDVKKSRGSYSSSKSSSSECADDKDINAQQAVSEQVCSVVEDSHATETELGKNKAAATNKKSDSRIQKFEVSRKEAICADKVSFAQKKEATEKQLAEEKRKSKEKKLPPKSDDLRPKSPNLTETRSSPQHTRSLHQSPRHKSPHRSPRHRAREPKQISQPKRPAETKKEEHPQSEEKTDELVSSLWHVCCS